MYKSRIGYRFSEETQQQFSTYNCKLDIQNPEQYCVATIQDAQNAIQLAKMAFTSYRLTGSSQRIAFLNSIASELNNVRNSLIEMYCKESSLSEHRANVELDRTIFQLKSFAEFLSTQNWDRPLTSKTNDGIYTIQTSLQAIGPVAVFGSSNFPFAYSTIGGDVASALAAGCPVIVKAHPMHAGTSYLVSEIVIESAQKNGLPDGVFSHLFDVGYEVGEELVYNKQIKAVGFTGSIRGGRALMDIASKRNAPIPVFAEMGSINPVLFFEDELKKNLELWVDKFKNSISNDAGQFCTKPGLLFVPNSPIGNEFLLELKNQLSLMSPECHLHPNLYENYKKQVEESFEWVDCTKKYHSQPTLRIVTSTEYLNNYKLHEEFFGPQAIATTYNDMEELRAMLAKLQGQLTISLIASDEELLTNTPLFEEVTEKAGRIVVNGVPTGVTVCDAMVHGGIYPAASDSRYTAVGSQSIYRFLRPVAIQRI